MLSTNDSAWLVDAANGQKTGPFIGAYQKQGSDEPSGGWHWVSGEAFDFQVWNISEPNNTFGGTENRIQFRWADTNAPARWNDCTDFPRGNVISYIVEYDYIPKFEFEPNIVSAVGIYWSSTTDVSQVEYSVDLESGEWLPLDHRIETNVNGFGVFDRIDGEQKFYRLLLK